MKFCKKCCQMTFSKDVMTYQVVNPMPYKVILKTGFDTFEEAREWSNKSRVNSRVEEHVKGQICLICKGER